MNPVIVFKSIIKGPSLENVGPSKFKTSPLQFVPSAILFAFNYAISIGHIDLTL